MKFITKNSSHSTLHVGYKEKYIEETYSAKFLGSEIVNHIKWKNHFKQGISKLSGRDYAVRSVVHISNVHTQTNVLCILPFCYKIWNNTGGQLFLQWEEFLFTKENYQNYGCCTIQNLM